MEGGALIKDRAQHLQIDLAVHRRTGADDLRQVGMALQYDQCAGLCLRKTLCRIANGNDGTAPGPFKAGVVVPPFHAEQFGCPLVGLTHAFQRTADLRLEQHHQGQQAHLQQRVQQPGDGAHIHHVGDQVYSQDHQCAFGQLALPGYG